MHLRQQQFEQKINIFQRSVSMKCGGIHPSVALVDHHLPFHLRQQQFELAKDKYF